MKQLLISKIKEKTMQMAEFNHSKTIINSIQVHSLEVDKIASDYLKSLLNKLLFHSDTEDSLIQQLIALGLKPTVLDEVNIATKALMIDDPDVGKAVIYLNEITVSIH